MDRGARRVALWTFVKALHRLEGWEEPWEFLFLVGHPGFQVANEG